MDGILNNKKLNLFHKIEIKEPCELYFVHKTKDELYLYYWWTKWSRVSIDNRKNYEIFSQIFKVMDGKWFGTTGYCETLVRHEKHIFCSGVNYFEHSEGKPAEDGKGYITFTKKYFSNRIQVRTIGAEPGPLLFTCRRIQIRSRNAYPYFIMDAGYSMDTRVLTVTDNGLKLSRNLS
jgi:hypothetical protein